jgi:hypothetical protein
MRAPLVTQNEKRLGFAVTSESSHKNIAKVLLTQWKKSQQCPQSATIGAICNSIALNEGGEPILWRK